VVAAVIKYVFLYQAKRHDMTTGLGKSNAVPVEHGEARNLASPMRYRGKVPPQEEQPYVFFQGSSFNDTVADSSYTIDKRVENFAREIVTVDRDTLATHIPRWAAWLFAAGNTAALGGLLAICITQNSHFLLAIAAGLAAAAVGLRAAEQAISDVQH
jgi:hypothetical protein